MSRYVAIMIDDHVTVHANGNEGPSDYTSLCGIDANDTCIGHKQVALPKKAKITCKQCYLLWVAWKQIKRSDFQWEGNDE